MPLPLPTSRRARALIFGLVLVLVACSSSGAQPGADGTVAETTTTRPATTTTTKPLRSFTIAASGDILLHMPVQSRARSNAGGTGYDFSPMFAQVADEISAADIAICHQETPISATNTNLSGYPIFNSPKEIVTALAAAGFDGCDTASNHSVDKGLKGVQDTASVFDAAGLKHTGSFGSPELAVDGGGVLHAAKGVSVGHLAYTYGTNGLLLEAPWELNINNATKMLADAHALKAKGAEVVVMSVHWGAEYQAQPTPDQIALAHQLLDSPDVDLILGDHVHVVQPMEKYNGKYVIYGMGNFLSNQSPQSDRTLIASTQDGGIYAWTMQEQTSGGFMATAATYTPTYVHSPDYVITKTSPSVQKDSFVRTVKAVNLLGAGTNDAVCTTGPVDGLLPTTTTAKPTTTTTTRPVAATTVLAPTTTRR